MKYTLPTANYSFNASAKTITFSGTIPARISNVMHVANITRGAIYFQPQAGVAFSGSYTSPVLTLAASTSGHSSSDELLIVLDDSTTALTDAQLRASAVPVSVSGVATAANQATTNTTLGNIDGKTAALINGRSGVEPLGQPGVARQLAASSTSTNTALTTTCRRISAFARGADIRFAIGSSSQTASSTSHYIANGERLDLVVPATPNIAVIRAGSIDGTLEVSELV